MIMPKKKNKPAVKKQAKRIDYRNAMDTVQRKQEKLNEPIVIERMHVEFIEELEAELCAKGLRMFLSHRVHLGKNSNSSTRCLMDLPVTQYNFFAGLIMCDHNTIDVYTHGTLDKVSWNSMKYNLECTQ